MHRLRKYAEKKGIKFKKIAEDLGISQTHLSYLLNGKSIGSKLMNAHIDEYIKKKDNSKL